MKKCILFLVGLFFVFGNSFVSAQENWEIANFESDITIQTDGKVRIVETIVADFGAEQRHGIFRDIPFAYEATGQKTYTEIDAISVAANGENIPHEVNRNKATVRIKIGDPDQLISGVQNYEIEYLATGVLRSFEGFDELYWNVTGNEWPVRIQKSSATLHLPEEGVVQSDCFLGSYGSGIPCDTEQVNTKTITFASPSPLNAYQGLTIAIGYTSDMVPILTADPPKIIANTIGNSTTILTFLGTLIAGLFLILRLWWQKGRDHYLKRTSLHDEDQSAEVMPLGAHENIVVEYESPEDLRPAEIGVLMDERADTLDISATIVDLGVRGYLTITEIPKTWKFGKIDYKLKRTEKSGKGLLNYETKLLSSLFKIVDTVSLSDLKNSFYDDLRKIKKDLYTEVTNKNLFFDNPESIRGKYLGWAIGLLVISIIFLAVGIFTITGIVIGLGGALGLCAICFIVVSFAMPRKTALGRELYRKARGYEVFISNAEKHRQRFFENENTFMQVLPYAIVFGATKKLATAMKQMGVKAAEVAPHWYSGTRPFDAGRFGNDIGTFSKSLSTAIASTPGGSGSSGGGFSGGGFGGGGGGSW